MKAQIARCPKCNRVVLASVIPVDKDGIKEFAELMQDGFPITTEDVPEKNWEWCNTECNKQNDMTDHSQKAFEDIATAYPKEAHIQDPQRFCEFVRSKGNNLSDDEIKKMLDENVK